MNAPSAPKRPQRLPAFVQARRNGRFRGWAMVNGRRVYGPTRTDAIHAHRDAIALREGDTATPAVTKTLRAAAAAMHSELSGVRRAGTVAFYQQQARAIFRFVDGNLPLARLTPAVLQELVRLAQLGGFSARTIQHYRRWLNRLVNWCQRPQRQWVRGPNPVPLVTWPEPANTLPDVLTEHELAGFLEQLRAEPFEHDLVLLVAYTGLRRAELARVRVQDLDLARSVLWVRGKVKEEAAPIAAAVADAARRLVEVVTVRTTGAAGPSGYVVPGVDELQRVHWIDRMFRRWAERFGDRRFHPHALRHSLATNLVRAGVETGIVQRMMRHSSFTTTQRYVHLVAADLHGASARLRYVATENSKRT